jgi:Na+-transporting NADH:ubiquinone oxidoreductase subunit A
MTPNSLTRRQFCHTAAAAAGNARRDMAEGRRWRGKLFAEGVFDPVKTIALVGSEVEKPKYYRTRIGASIKSIVQGKVSTDKELRYISGNPLTGERVKEDGHLGFFHNQVTVLPEGNKKKFFLTEGWLSPGLNKFSMSKAYPSWLFPNKRYALDTNKNGEKRAYVVTGQYEQVFPFEIYPQQLVKSIIIQDLDLMEKLGIYEVDAEDFALCEFVCTSKQPVQRIVRNGLDQLKEETS